MWLICQSEDRPMAATPNAAIPGRPGLLASEGLLPLFLLAAGSIGTLVWNVILFTMLLELLD